jgi:hypothetical protein
MLYENPMAPVVGYRSSGLCSTCNNQPTCPYRSRRGFDAQFCELFDNEVDIELATAERPAARLEVGGRVNREGNLKGLCMNCEKASTCGFPKPDSGVWHCEEYE